MAAASSMEYANRSVVTGGGAVSGIVSINSIGGVKTKWKACSKQVVAGQNEAAFWDSDVPKNDLVNVL
jgi:hypothetical protein